MDQLKQVSDYIEEKNKTTTLGEINKNIEELGIDVKVGEWLKDDKNMLEYAKIAIKEKKTFGESLKISLLELRLSVTCPYFADFKDFLEELKEGEVVSDKKDKYGSNNTEIIYGDSLFQGISISDIKSLPFYKNSKSGVTRCGATARFNGENFGVNLPSGDAYDAGKVPGKAPVLSPCEKTIPDSKKNDRPQSSWDPIAATEFSGTDININFADIYVDSKSSYGHRAVAFKDNKGEWYVLDPYTRVNGIMNNDPRKLEDYAKVRPILKAHFYQSKKYEFKNKSYA